MSDLKNKIMKETTIPFGASDSELMKATYFIPQGYHAVIDGDKVIIKKGEEPISNDLEQAAVEAFKHIVDSDKNNFYEIFKAGAKWGMRQAEVKIQAQSMDLDHGCPNDFAGSNLEEKANQLSQKYFPDEENIWARSNIEAHKCKSACIEMVEWLKAQKGE